MEGSPPEESGSGASTDPAEWIEAFRRQCAAVEHAADEWGVRWQEPEGRFVAALLGAMQTFSRLAILAQASIEATTREGRASAEIELRRVRELTQAVETVNLQARNAQVLMVVERENLVQRMIKETMPEFVTAMKAALVIRETRWNRRKESVRFALAGVCFVSVFAAGYAASLWGEEDQLVAFDGCLASVFSANGHLYCRLDGAVLQAPASARRE
jgi:hypothetical protein